MYTKWINIAGLCFDLVGALTMFGFTPHPRLSLDQLQYILGNEEKTEKREKKWVKRGLIFLIVGFLLQLISALMD